MTKKRVGYQMVRAAIKEASALQRKQYVPDSDRTSDRDELAESLENKYVDGDRDWQEATISGIADETGWSREHVARTLDAYFDPVSGGRSDVIDELATAIVDTDASGDDYADGFRDGFEAGLQFAINNSDLVK